MARSSHESCSCACLRDQCPCLRHVFAQTPQSDGPTLPPLWTLTTDFAAPESAYFDAGSNAVFVSSINGQILEKDGNGYISRLSPDGKMVSAKWVTGLNAPKGHAQPRRDALGDRHRRGRVDRHRHRAHHRTSEGRGRPVPQRSRDRARWDGLRVGLGPVRRSLLSRTASLPSFVQKNDVGETRTGSWSTVHASFSEPSAAGWPRGAGCGGPPPSGHLYAFDLEDETAHPADDGGGRRDRRDRARWSRGDLLITDVIGARLLHVPRPVRSRVLAKFSGVAPTSATSARRASQSSRSSSGTASPPTT